VRRDDIADQGIEEFTLKKEDLHEMHCVNVNWIKIA
jgi:hypothetical protein